MKPGDLISHGQTQAQANTGAGIVRLIETAENFLLLFPVDTDSVICHGQMQLFLPRPEPDPDMSVFPAITVGIADQIGQQPGKELAVPIKSHSFFHLKLKRNLFLPDQRHIRTDRRNQFRHIDIYLSISV